MAEQSGLKAGGGGFQLTVKGDTTLTGGVNRLNTTATHLSDLHNQASYKASGYNINVGVSSSKPSGSAASDIRAGISGSACNSSVRSGDAETGMANPTFTPPAASRPPSGLAGAAAGQAGRLSECVRRSCRPRLAAGGHDSRCAGLQQAREYRHRSVPRIKQQPR
ncbi:hypothetical protein QF022_002674 [Vogesella perlucida]|nr:hypothetical protein [Vogesella perlucida]